MLKIIFLLYALILVSDCYIEDNGYKLERVLILSRHNVRSPLADLNQTTTKQWPVWNDKGQLTQKGYKLEGYMGAFFFKWLNTLGLLSNGCPGDDFYVYANVKQRTMESARSFASHAFPGCNVTVNHANSDFDPTFQPFIHNTTSVFRTEALTAMVETISNLNLNDTYQMFEDILDYKHSNFCLVYGKCDLMRDKNNIDIIVGSKPIVKGPLKIGNTVADALIMAYFEGLPLDQVGWNMITSDEQWLKITNVTNSYHNVIFNSSIIAEDIARPLIIFLKKMLLNESRKLTLLMGHDANMITVMKTLRFKSYNLPNQYESTPVGSKIVFQKWFDKNNNKYLLKILFVYQSNKQLRNELPLSMHSPPHSVIMELHDCETDEHGFCDWDKFVMILQNLMNI